MTQSLSSTLSNAVKMSLTISNVLLTPSLSSSDGAREAARPGEGSFTGSLHVLLTACQDQEQGRGRLVPGSVAPAAGCGDEPSPPLLMGSLHGSCPSIGTMNQIAAGRESALIFSRDKLSGLTSAATRFMGRS